MMKSLARPRLAFGLLLGFPIFATLALLGEPATPPTAAPATQPVDDAHDNSAPETPPKIDPVAAEFFRAIKLLEGRTSADLAAGRAALQAASDLEYTHAQVLLGNCLLSGSYGFPKAPKKATNLFRLAAERGNAFAEVSLGLCYYYGTGVKKDESAAVKWLTAAVAPDANYQRPVAPSGFFEDHSSSKNKTEETISGGNMGSDPGAQSQATAHHLLGLILTHAGKLTEAQPHFVAAATAGADGRSGIFQAAQQAALNFAFGQGTARDLPKAKEMLECTRKLTATKVVSIIHNYVSLKMVDEFAAADLEESVNEAGAKAQTDLQNEIAERFANKKSAEYNPPEAVQWYELAAENGKVWAMLSLAFIYSRGDLGQPDPVKAFQWFEKAGGGETPKHYLGVANLGICYQNGLGVEKNPAKAAALFSKHRDSDIVCYLATIGQCPAKTVSFEEALALNQTWAKEKEDPHAQFLLGLRYDDGAGVESSYVKANQWYKKAMKKNHPIAMYRLALDHEKYPSLMGDSSAAQGLKVAAGLMKNASDLRYLQAMLHYALMLSNGAGTPKNEEQSTALYRQCLELDPANRVAHNNLAVYYEGLLQLALAGTDQQQIASLREKMLHHYAEAVRSKGDYGAFNLANLHYKGVLVPKDLHKAYEHFEMAAEWGYGAEAHFLLGLMHENGEGLPVTYSEAAYHYRLAALDGHIEALRHLVNFYLTGKGVSRDLDRATFWLAKMMRAGKPGVILIYVDILLQKQEYQSAVELLKNLRDSENTYISGFAYDRLSQCYRNGQGVKTNPDKARQYFDKAVKLGNDHALTTLALRQLKEGNKTDAIANLEAAAKTSGPACFYLGQMNFFGTNMPKDRVKALRFFRAASDLEHPEALYFLAGLTYNRETDAPSLNEAIDMLQRAESVGHAKATELREKLEQRRQKNLTVPDDTSKARSS